MHDIYTHTSHTHKHLSPSQYHTQPNEMEFEILLFHIFFVERDWSWLVKHQRGRTKKPNCCSTFFSEWMNANCVLTIFVTFIAKCANWVKQRSGGRQGRAGGRFSQASVTCNPGRFGPCRFGPAFKQDAVPGDNGEDEHSIGEGRRGTVFNFQGSLCHPFKLLNSEVSDWA